VRFEAILAGRRQGAVDRHGRRPPDETTQYGEVDAVFRDLGSYQRDQGLRGFSDSAHHRGPFDRSADGATVQRHDRADLRAARVVRGQSEHPLDAVTHWLAPFTRSSSPVP
jgi:hypothetical protein